MRGGCASLLALASLFAACAHSTPEPLPEDAVPHAWETNASTSTAAAELEWWRAFADPVLDQLIDRARSQSLDVRIADARIREARAVRSGAGAELWPELDANAAVTVARATGSAKARDFRAGLSASWEADLFGRLRSDERAAVADVKSVEADRDAVELLLCTEVAESYIEYRLRRVQLVLSLQTAEAQDRTVRITRARYEQGTASGFDLSRALSALALTRARIPEATELSAAARHRLSLLLAEPSELVTRELESDRPLPTQDPLGALATPADVIAHRPDVRSAEWHLLSSLAHRDAAEALRYPRLTLSGIVGVDSEHIGELFNPMAVFASIGAGLFAPILDFGRIHAQIDVADAQQERAYLEYERTVRTAIEEAQTAIIFYAEGVTKQKELGDALASAKKAADFARIQYREGTLGLLEVLDAERLLRDAELSWSQATADVSVRLIAVHRTLGG